MKIMFDNMNAQLELQCNEIQKIKSRIATAEARLRDPMNNPTI